MGNTTKNRALGRLVSLIVKNGDQLLDKGGKIVSNNARADEPNATVLLETSEIFSPDFKHPETGEPFRKWIEIQIVMKFK